MYWFRTGDPIGGFLLASLLLATTVGGWLLAGRAFELASRERLVAGAALGLVLMTWSANVLGHWLPSSLAFVMAPGLVLAGGIGASLGPGRAGIGRRDLQAWPMLLILAGLALVFTMMGRGMSVFDDRKALSIISTLAAGDIPPRFYMNWETPFKYHYGFHLLGAILMKVGGLFPWSAFDVSKGITASLAVGLAGLWGRRAIPRWWGGLAVALLALFASGSRWLLLLLPRSVQVWLSGSIALWGSASQSAPDLASGLTSGWTLEGGPPIPIPFAFVNGVFQPYILHLQAGPKSLALVAFFLVLLLGSRVRTGYGWPLLVVTLALWALAAEAEFVLFGIGTVLALLLLRPWRRARVWRSQARPVMGSLLAAGALGLIQGGTLTETFRGLVANAGAAPEAAGGLGGFSLRWPPAIVSAHLGELPLHRPGTLLVGLAEFGPALALVPLIVWVAIRAVRRGRFLMLAVLLSTLVGFLAPLFVRYEVDRDITRMAYYALLSWVLLSTPVLAARARIRPSGRFRTAILACGGLTCLGGWIVMGPLLTAISTPTLSTEIALVDAAMTRAVWDRLPAEATVLDSHSWRAVAVTGRPTRSAANSSRTLDSWSDLTAAPEAGRVARAGFDYVYVDTWWWDSMAEGVRASYLAPCVARTAETHDNGANGSRWLFDVRRCGGE